MTERWWRFAWAWTIGALLITGLACSNNPDPPGPEPCKPAPNVEGRADWTGTDQLLVSWPDMPGVVVGGGDEACVLKRRVVVQMKEVREVAQIATFMAVDTGDSAEGLAIVYDHQGQKLYERSPHWERASEDCYDADDSAPPLIPGATTNTLFVDILHRTTGNNTQGAPTSRPHYTVTVSFGSSPPPPPPPGCEIPPEPDPRWRVLGSSTENPQTPGELDFADTRKKLNAAKAAVGDRSGQDPVETLRLLAQAIVNAGGCAMQWADELLIMISSTTGDSYHPVAFGTGGYAGRPDRDRWTVDPAAPSGCGAPAPAPAHHIKVKLHQVEPKPTYDGTGLVGPDAAYCAAIGYTDGRAFCPVRPDGHPERAACEEAVFGTPVWTFDGEGECFSRPNPWAYRCELDAHGTLTVCGSKATLACGSIEVEAVAPGAADRGLLRKGAAELSEGSKVAIKLILAYVLDFLKWLW